MEILDSLKKLVKEESTKYGIIKLSEIINIPLKELETFMFTKPHHRKLLFSTVIEIADYFNFQLNIENNTVE